MIIVIMIVFLLSFMIIPINYIIQQKNESILKLFSTISAEKLLEMLKSLLISLSQHKTGKYKIKNLNNLKKRRGISSTSSIPKISLIHFWFITIGIILMII